MPNGIWDVNAFQAFRLKYCCDVNVDGGGGGGVNTICNQQQVADEIMSGPDEETFRY